MPLSSLKHGTFKSLGGQGLYFVFFDEEEEEEEEELAQPVTANKEITMATTNKIGFEFMSYLFF